MVLGMSQLKWFDLKIKPKKKDYPILAYIVNTFWWVGSLAT